MFRMEFHSLDAVVEDDEGRGSDVYEECRGSGSATATAPTKVYEGRVGKFGKMQRVASSNHAVHQRAPGSPPAMMTRSMSTNDSIPNNWAEVDLIDFDTSKPEGSVIRELVKPFAESVKLHNVGASATPLDLLSDGVPPTTLQVRTDSVLSPKSDTLDTKDEEKGSPATRAYNRAFSKMMNKKSKSPVQVVSKPWAEPLLAAHEQAKLQRKLQKEAKVEARRVAEEAKRDAEMQQRELLELANPVPESALNLKKDHGVRKGIHKLFHIHGGAHSSQNSPREGVAVDAREAKLVMPRSGFFESSMMSPTTKDTTLSQIRTGPRPTARKDITFATVESNQRDVQPWTMEEYMAKNARQAEWKRRVDDEEFGGIEGNQLMNQYFDNDLNSPFDSDSD